jgi:dihydroorotate dehydrogenase electron transfer subunit
MPTDVTTAVSRNQDLGHGSFLLEFDAPGIAADAHPGQFCMIGIPGSEVLLRRPFSFCGLPGTFEDSASGSVQILYKVVGRGTALLASLKTGAPLDVLGPLGRGFGTTLPPSTRAVLVAGGIGSAPFPALAAALAGAGIPSTFYYGARTSGDLPLLDWFRARCAELVVTTEDGSVGEKGLITEPLERALRQRDHGGIRLFGCGPSPMLKALAATASACGVACELSLEAHMACGFGVCLGCVVATRAGADGGVRYERVCVEGPVMPGERLAW